MKTEEREAAAVSRISKSIIGVVIIGAVTAGAFIDRTLVPVSTCVWGTCVTAPNPWSGPILGALSGLVMGIFIGLVIGVAVLFRSWPS